MPINVIITIIAIVYNDVIVYMIMCVYYIISFVNLIRMGDDLLI